MSAVTPQIAAATDIDSGAPPRVALVTGACGFTGHYVTAALRTRGYRVTGLTHAGADVSAGADSLHDLHACDLLDRTRLLGLIEHIQPTHVVHLAAIAFVAHGDTDAIYRTNIVGTRNLLEALAAKSAPLVSVLLASSANVYGNIEADPIDEAVPPAPANDYAVSKLAMEFMARLWLDRLPITIVRPFNYTGVGQSQEFVLPKIVEHFVRGERSIELGNLDVARDFSDVRTVADTYCRLLESAASGETFNLCSGRAVSLRWVLDTLAEIAGYPIEVHFNPALARANEVRRLRGSDAKLRTRVGTPLRIPLEQTLGWMFEAAATSSAAPRSPNRPSR
ncbi:MAG: NAD-dependent epimerase/dehydratase family protein [Immundisolibacter sp.]|uniref:NAD-dependent epimerase/dehydratase family protein n=1 Tax=Immundisolibacter sp. TaxID=1934948 RepID=UPI003EE135E9